MEYPPLEFPSISFANAQMLMENRVAVNQEFSKFPLLVYSKVTMVSKEIIVIIDILLIIQHSTFHQLILPTCKCWQKTEGSLKFYLKISNLGSFPEKPCNHDHSKCPQLFFAYPPIEYPGFGFWRIRPANTQRSASNLRFNEFLFESSEHMEFFQKSYIEIFIVPPVIPRYSAIRRPATLTLQKILTKCRRITYRH